MDEETLRGQLATVNESLPFLVLILCSVLLSLWGVLLQREGLENTLCGREEALPPVLSIRRKAGLLVTGALGYFFCLALKSWEAARGADPAARRPAELNLWASLFVLAAALIRLYDISLAGAGAAGVGEDQPA